MRSGRFTAQRDFLLTITDIRSSESLQRVKTPDNPSPRDSRFQLGRSGRVKPQARLCEGNNLPD